MPTAVGIIFLILLSAFILRLLKQPHLIAYLVAGIIIGPFATGLVTDIETISRLGSMGVVLLLFFVGMEIDPIKLMSNWKLAIFGTLLQILLSVGSIWLLSFWVDWPLARVVLLGFVISLSSTAVVIKLMDSHKLLDSKIGQGVLAITLVQDLAIIPMLIVIGFFENNSPDTNILLKQATGAILTILLFTWIFRKKVFHFPLGKWLQEDRELQLFAALTLCFGLSLLTAWLNLSTALGAFLAGMLVGIARETQWVHQTLESFKTLFIALFFASIGMMIDLDFLRSNLVLVFGLVAAALVTNTFINALVLKLARFSSTDSMYAGLLLAQISEFGFVLAAVGQQSGILNSTGYQFAICTIALSLVLSPIWITIGSKLFISPFQHTGK